MLEITIKIKGEPGSGKSNFVKNFEGFMKDCPHEFEVSVWTKQPASPIWIRELLLKSAGQFVNHTEVISDVEPI